MTKKEIPGRKIIQEKRMDEAITKVEKQLLKGSGVFSERLNEHMNLEHSPQRQSLAKAMKSANSTVTSWEVYTPQNFHKLRELCKFLDLDANYLLGLSGEKKTLTEVLTNIKDYCEHCGCNELLCGEGGPGCTSARANQ